MIRLTIAIPTVLGREAEFNSLFNKIKVQANAFLDVEVISLKDNKEISIGQKRNNLYSMAKGLYTVQIDDDDSVPMDYVQKIMSAIEFDCDCIGYIESCVINGAQQYSKISLDYPEWQTLNPVSGGFNYTRTPFFKVPIKTSICKEIGVADMRFGEDHDFAKRIYPHLKDCYFINEVMYYYTAKSLTQQEHKERYGL